MPLIQGQLAPDFEQDTANGSLRLHEWLNGAWGLLLIQAGVPTLNFLTGLAGVAPHWRRRGVKLIAVAPSLPDRLADSAVPFPIVVDHDGRVAELYALPRQAATAQCVTVIDPAHRVRRAQMLPRAIGWNSSGLLRVVDALRRSGTAVAIVLLLLAILAAPTAQAGDCVSAGGKQTCTGFFRPASGTVAIDDTSIGRSGSSGRDGALIVSAKSGNSGADGNALTDQVQSADIATADAFGIKLLSLGGDGGKGGNAYIGRSAADGATGSSGGTIRLDITGVPIVTSGTAAFGVVAISSGGNGGPGGAGYLSGGGGDGGQGGVGGGVTITLDSLTRITTTGDQAFAILVQSRGGIGGSGGTSILGGGGGSGGAGANGGSLTLNLAGFISTSGARANAVLAQSIGGFGGAGGDGIGFRTSGGDGRTAGNGGTVDLLNAGNVRTSGTDARGVVAQSIGGGGGLGGDAFGAGNVGGYGGSGGDGGTVTARSSGQITTTGDRSTALLVQSVGGGGGDGGNSGGIFSIGGSGGSGGSGGTVTVRQSGSLATSGTGSPGLQAQSIGDGGGSGGAALSVGPFASVSVGGSGARGGTGGTVNVNTIQAADGSALPGSVITTYGDNSAGMLVQSVGGGGGRGGWSASVSAGPIAGSVSLGGSAGKGGAGGEVKIDANAAIGTLGDNARGIQAQSTGGGGGDGGLAVSFAGAASGAASVAMGGSGGDGGAGGAVTVNWNGLLGGISTQGARSDGILAQSTGGGGGSGGISVSGAASGGVGAASVSLGGAAGNGGGTGGAVRIVADGNVTTTGAGAAGIIGQSTGGGGGAGGISISGTFGTGASLSASVGGAGGGGQNSGMVQVFETGVVSTAGANATGVMAVSTAGGGGMGGISGNAAVGTGPVTIGVTLGGTGGSGGVGGLATAYFAGNLDTAGNWSGGVSAKSTGGGGGRGGLSVGLSGGGTVSGTVSLGGAGATGGTGGDARAETSGRITTAGANAPGVEATSLGGSGGDGGLALSSNLALGIGGFAVSVGGKGAGGGDSGAASVTNLANVSTSGAQSAGLVAQSTAGGGGAGGLSGSLASSLGVKGKASVSLSLGGTGGRGGTAGAVAVTNVGNISTSGDNAPDIFAQSLGGGGGRGGISVSVDGGTNMGPNVSLGGSGGAGGFGGAVSVSNLIPRNLVTGGNFSPGIFAQSLGGGGGTGGFSVVGSFNPNTPTLGVSLGASGGTGGLGGAVWVAADGNITTSGASSQGIFAQSLGGGGGDGGFAGSIGAGGSTVNVSLSIGGNGGSGATASSATLTKTGGTVTTMGDLSAGLVAQSTGGGGGNGGLSVVAAGGAPNGITVAVGGFGGIGGTGGTANLSLLNGGTVNTSGAKSYGLYAESIGGGGGRGGMAVSGTVNLGGYNASSSVGGVGGRGNISDTVTLYSSGSVSTGGAGAYAIFAQSIGGGGGSGGFAGTAILQTAPGTNLTSAVGGDGGDGANAGTVLVTLDGSQYGGRIGTTGAGATAVFAQSLGGGGGDGGFAFTGVLSSAASIDINATVGGRGGAAGNGASVAVGSNQVISTMGANALGIFAQSVGGGGGNGGMAVAGNLDASANARQIGVTVGGNGGGGGDGKSVVVSNDGAISATGDSATAILAQSIGGGGGNGGISFSGAISGKNSVNASVAVGGLGKSGGQGDTVTIINTGDLTLSGRSGVGIFAQSVGGGGGIGGAAGAMTIGGETTWNASVSVGGNGGLGGRSGSVAVVQSGAISTLGENGDAIFVQSLAGGGGRGGMAGIDPAVISKYLAGSSQSIGFGNYSMSLAIAVGGNGGAGANPGELVSVANLGSLTTSGDFARGIFAQSVGGGGGDAGVAGATAGALDAPNGSSTSIAVGGRGGAAGNGGVVQITNTGTISTQGASSHGVQAQSVGGGGGNGGDAKGAAQTFAFGYGQPTAAKQYNFSFAIGGTGGASGSGNIVTVANTGAMTIAGSQSFGIFAQSVGGGGGNGGSIGGNGNEVLKLAQLVNKYYTSYGGEKGPDSLSFSVNVGGAGGANGNGGAVMVSNDGGIATTGYGGHAIFAQSLGGGGGNGGNGATGRINVGGAGAVSGTGGNVTVFNTGALSTTDDLARGIQAQSIGGGGGNGGATNSISRTDQLSLNSVVKFADKLKAAADGLTSINLGVSIGGAGGAAGDGGNIVVDNSGTIRTAGLNSHGIFAQSVGGGGGTGGEGVLMNLGQITVPGNAGNSGDGGGVSVTNRAAITTSGQAAHGIFAQSVGDGGGVAGAYSLGIAAVTDVPGLSSFRANNFLSLGVNPVTGNGGNGGAVSVNNSGNIAVSGIGSIGILAQSVGGSGGLMGGTGSLAFLGSLGQKGTGGPVTLTNTGNIRADGSNGVGILLQSDGKGRNGNITATIGGTIRGGADNGTGITISGGSTNLITINGTVSAVSGNAIRGGNGDDSIVNTGIIAGSIDLAAGTNAIANNGTGRLETGSLVTLTPGNTLTNNATMVPGGGRQLQTTTLTGNYVQTSTGTLNIYLDGSPASSATQVSTSRLTIFGTAAMAGRVRLSPLTGGGLPLSGAYSSTILSASGGISGAGATSFTSASSLINNLRMDTAGKEWTAFYTVAYNRPTLRLSPSQISVANAVSAVATLTAPPATASVTASQSAVSSAFSAGAIQSALPAASSITTDAAAAPSFADALAAVEVADSDTALAQVYESFSPNAHALARAGTIMAAHGFNVGLLGHGATASYTGGGDGGGSGDLSAMDDAGRIAWVDVFSRSTSNQFTAGTSWEKGSGVHAGVEGRAGDGWRIGAAFSIEAFRLGVKGESSGNGWRMATGMSFGHALGPLNAQLAVSAGYQSSTSTRMVDGPSGFLAARSEQPSLWTAATLRLSHAIDVGRVEIRPLFDLTASVLHAPAISESGAGDLGLRLHSNTHAALRAAPAVEFSGLTDIAGMTVQPFVRLGASGWLLGGSPIVTAAFENAPAGTPDLSSRQPNPGILADIALGLTLHDDNGMNLRLVYDGHLNARTQIHALTGRVGWRF